MLFSAERRKYLGVATPDAVGKPIRRKGRYRSLLFDICRTGCLLSTIPEWRGANSTGPPLPPGAVAVVPLNLSACQLYSTGPGSGPAIGMQSILAQFLSHPWRIELHEHPKIEVFMICAKCDELSRRRRNPWKPELGTVATRYLLQGVRWYLRVQIKTNIACKLQKHTHYDAASWE